MRNRIRITSLAAALVVLAAGTQGQPNPARLVPAAAGG